MLGSLRPVVPESSALRVLRGATGLAKAVLLALDRPGVAGEQIRLLQCGPELRLHLDECPGNPEPKSVGLPGGSPAFELRFDVVASLGTDRAQRLEHANALGHAGEVLLDRFAVEPDLAGSVVDANPHHRRLTAADGLGKRLWHQASTFRDWRARGRGI